MNIKETKLVSINPESANVLSELSIKTFMQAYKDVHSLADLEAWCAHNYTQQACETLLKQANVEAVVGYKNQTPAGFYLIKHHTCPIQLDGIHSELKQMYPIYLNVLFSELSQRFQYKAHV